MACERMGRLLLAVLLIPGIACAQAGEVTVSAAASLTGAFREIARDLEAARPGSRVLLNFGGSGALLQQIARGAPVDVLAAADEETIAAAVAQGLVARGEARIFARNSLVLIVPAGSRLAIGKLEDLSRGSVQRVAIGNPANVPAGRHAQRALEAAGVWADLQGRMVLTQNVRQALEYVARGEVDAGFVYATDAGLIRDRVTVARNVPTDVAIRYPIAAIQGSANPLEAARFVDYVSSPDGQAILRRHGFGAP